MLDTDSIDKFIEMVKGGNGKIISTRLTRPFFEKRGNPELWDYFVEVSSHLEMLPSQKIALYLETGKFEHPKCVVCGKPVRMMRTHFSKYCSNACKSAHGEVAKRISETKKKADHTLSNEKRKQTMMEKYGCEYNSQREDIHHIWTQPKLPIDSHNKLHSKEWLFEEYVNKHRSSASIAKELGCHFMTVIYACRDFGIETIFNDWGRIITCGIWCIILIGCVKYGTYDGCDAGSGNCSLFSVTFKRKWKVKR